MRSLIAAFIGLAALSLTLPAQADEVEVIQLRHTMAEQLIPTLRPLVQPGGALTGTQSSLIIRSSRENIEQIRAVIATLDKAPRRLMIYVRQSDSALYNRSRAGVSGRVSSGDASVSINGARREGVQAHILDSRTASDEAFDSQVQGLDGSPAYIAVGQSIPTPISSYTRMPDGRIINDSSTEYRDITSGVYVVPRVIGDRVTLQIQPQRDTPGRYGPGSANIQHLDTTASGRLGEWIELGGVSQSSNTESRGTLSSRSSGTQGTRSIWVKVEELR